MAQPRLDTPTTTIQPTPGTQPSDVQALEVEASAQTRQSQALVEIGGQLQSVAVTVMRDETLRQAQNDAAQIVTAGDIDGKRGLGGILYNQTYNEAAIQNYRGIALDEAKNKTVDLLTQYPTNPDKVKSELSTYLDAKKAAMPAYMAETMTPHFTAVLNGAVTSAQAGATRMDLSTIEKDSRRQLNGLVYDAATTYGSAAYQASSPDEQRATQAKFADQWQMISKGLSTVMTPTALASLDQEAGNAIRANVIGTQFKDMAAANWDKPIELQKIREQAIAWAKEPVRSAYYDQTIAILNGYIERGTAMAGAIGQADAMTQADFQGTIWKQFDQLKRDQQANPNMQREEYLRRHQEIVQNAINMGYGRRPAQQAQLLAAAGDSAPMIQQMYTSSMMAASNMAVNGFTRAERIQGHADVDALLADPTLRGMAGSSIQMASVVQQGQKVQALRVANALVADVALARLDMESDTTNELTARELLQKYTEQNLVDGPGGMGSAQAEQSIRIGIAKNKEKTTKEALASKEIKNWNANGGLPVSDASKAVVQEGQKGLYTKTKPNGTPGATGFDPADAEHMTKTVDTTVNTSVLPKEVETWAASIGPTSDPKQQQQLVSMVERIRGGLINRSSGMNVSANLRKIDVETSLDKILGSDIRNKTAAFIEGKYDPANIATVMKAQIENAGRNASPSELDNFRQKLTGMIEYGRTHPPSGIKDITKAIVSYIPGWSSGGEAWLHDNVSMFGNEGVAAVFGTLKNYHDRGNGPDAIGNVLVEDGNWRVSPSAAAQLESGVAGPGGYMETRAASYRAAGIKDPTQAATIAYMKEHPNDFSIRYSRGPDDKWYGSLEYKDFYAEFNRRNGTDWDEPKIKGFVGGVVKSLRGYQYSEIAPNTIGFAVEIGKGGAPYYYMVGKSKDLNDTRAFEIRPDDPQFNVQRATMGEAVGQDYKDGGLGDWVSRTPGLSIFREWIKNNKEDAWVDISSDRNLPTERMAEFLATIRKAAEAHNRMLESKGLPPDPFITPAEERRLATADGQAAIRRFGGPMFLFFGGANARFPAPERPNETITGFEPLDKTKSDPRAIRDVVTPPTTLPPPASESVQPVKPQENPAAKTRRQAPTGVTTEDQPPPPRGQGPY